MKNKDEKMNIFPSLYAPVGDFAVTESGCHTTIAMVTASSPRLQTGPGEMALNFHHTDTHIVHLYWSTYFCIDD